MNICVHHTGDIKNLPLVLYRYMAKCISMQGIMIILKTNRSLILLYIQVMKKKKKIITKNEF